jgi:hypothetical protein
MTIAAPQLPTSSLLRPCARPTRFPKDHAWDRAFYPLFIASIWLGVGLGFGPELVQHLKGGEAPYPLVVHLHAAAFVSWVVLLMAQSLLIRTGQRQIHRLLGIAAIGLAVIMLILGPAVAITIQRMQRGMAHPSPVFGNPAFLAVQLGGILAFAIMVTSGFLLRNKPSAHRRLMLLATLSISDAGLARWTSPWLHQVLGGGFWGDFAGNYAANDVLILALVAYDLVTRHRLHPALLAGASYLFLTQITAAALMQDAAWKAFTLHLISQ